MNVHFQKMAAVGLPLFLLVCLFGIVFADNETQNLCRVSGGMAFPPEMFALYSCATCYHYMDKGVFENGTKLIHHGMWLWDPRTLERYEPWYENRSSPIFNTFRSSKESGLWIGCCKAAVTCCETMRATPRTSSPDSDFCPRTWDGWNCWPDADAGVVENAECPSYIYFNTDDPLCTRYATKQCWDNGTWFRNFKGNEYSDYTTCGRSQDLKLLVRTHDITFGISIVLLIPALVIFFYYRQLKVHRIFMHKNLFISLLLTAVFVIIFENFFIVDSINNPKNILVSNQAGCKLFYTITKYLRLTTYTWMFCEGFYLHKLIAAAFAEQKSILVYHLIGWGLPAIPVGIWAIVRLLENDEMCWVVPDNLEWIFYVPMLGTLVVNFCFLAHIVAVIITKLRSTHADEPAQFRRAVKATMVLIPLFGLHFLFVSFNFKRGDCKMILVYNIITHSLDGLQGGIVAMLFCYLNNEVIFLLKRSYNRKKMVRDINSHMSSRKTARESRTSVSTNIESLANDGTLSKGSRKK